MNTAELDEFDGLLDNLDAFDLGEEFGFAGLKIFLKKKKKMCCVCNNKQTCSIKQKQIQM
jgi:hypothetical protein